MKYVCFIAIPRTGTNHLGRVVSGFKNIRSQYELFHKQAVYTLDKSEVEGVAPALGGGFEKFDDPAFVETVRAAPGRFLDALAAHHDGRYDALAFKVFPKHLDDAALKEDVLARPDVSVVIVRRRLLASYLSLRKAEEVKKYIDVDTTNLQVELKVRGYLDWRAEVLDWYSRVDAVLADLGKRPERLDYEREINTDPHTLAGVLVEKFARLGIETTRDHGEPPALEKQDKSKSLEDGVSNWSEFAATLAAEGVPLDD
ncbi:MAG: hypothetical protein AAFR11_11005 [Pseudomonadota bacterium]